MGDDLGAECAEQGLRKCACGDAGSGLASTGSLEDVAGIVEVVLLHTNEIGVAGTDTCERVGRMARGRVHLLVPLVGSEPLRVSDLDGNWRAEGAAVTHTAHQGDLVGLEPLSRTATVTETTAGEFGLDVVDGDLETGGQALDDHDKGATVGFTGGEEAQHDLQVTRGSAERLPRGRAHGGDIGLVARPDDLLECRLMNEHPESADDTAP